MRFHNLYVKYILTFMPKNPKISEFIDFVPVNIKLAGWIPKRVKSVFPQNEEYRIN